MNPALGHKWVGVIQPAVIKDNAAWTVVDVDTIGYDHAEIIFQVGATDIAVATLKVSESDDDSTYTDITASVMGTANNDTGSASTLPSSTDDNKLFSFVCDMRGHKRYLRLEATAGDGTAGTYANAIALLTRAESGPLTAAQAGLSQRMVL